MSVGPVTTGSSLPFFETGGGFDQTVHKVSDAFQYTLGATSAEAAENPTLTGCIILGLAAALVIAVLAYLIYKICKCAGCCCFGSQSNRQPQGYDSELMQAGSRRQIERPESKQPTTDSAQQLALT